MDGAALVAGDSEPTVVIERPAVETAGSSAPTIPATPTATAFGQNPPVRRRGGGVLLWVGIGIGMIAAIVIVAGVLLYFLGGRDRLFSGQPQGGGECSADAKAYGHAATIAFAIPFTGFFA